MNTKQRGNSPPPFCSPSPSPVPPSLRRHPITVNHRATANVLVHYCFARLYPQLFSERFLRYSVAAHSFSLQHCLTSAVLFPLLFVLLKMQNLC